MEYEVPLKSDTFKLHVRLYLFVSINDRRVYSKMVINNQNLECINRDICIHDCVFKGIQYDYQNNEAIVALYRECSKESVYIKFHEIAGINMVACDFWGAPPYVFDWIVYPKGEEKFLQQYKLEGIEKQYTFSKFNKANMLFFETEIILSSGDRLSIVCNKISITTHS